MTKIHKTREQWLNAAAHEIHNDYREVFDEHFGAEGEAHLSALLVSTGFPSRGGLGKVIGECWKSEASEGGAHHIFINPRLTDLVEVVATLAHEMVHAADNGEHKHRGKFLRAARGLGLEGKATATVAGGAFAEWARFLEKKIGTYPHEALTPLLVEKKQGTRQLKAEADCCGYIIRLTKKWAQIAMPSCPCGNEFVLEDPSILEDIA